MNKNQNQSAPRGGERVANHAKHQQMLKEHQMLRDGRHERRQLGPKKAKRQSEYLGFKPRWEGRYPHGRHGVTLSMLS